MRARRTAATLTASIVLATGGLLAGGAEAAGGGPNNVVTASTTGANATDQQSRVKVGSFGGDDLQSANIARAESQDCTDCRTVAVAVQAVFATGHPSRVEPQNAAIATNLRCVRCTTYAFAYQYVVLTDGPVHLGRKVKRRIARLRRKFATAARSDLAPADLDARLNELAARFKRVVYRGLQRAGEHPHGDAHKERDEAPQP